MNGQKGQALRLLPALILALAVWPSDGRADSAVAVANDLAYGYCYDLQGAEAASCALEWCREYSGEPESCAVGYSDSSIGAYALAMGDNGWGVGVSDDAASAKSKALEYCRQYSANCRIEEVWQESLGAGDEMGTTAPLNLMDAKRSVVLILTHGSDEEFIADKCHLDRIDSWQGTPSAVAALEGTMLADKRVFLDRFCTPTKVGTERTLKVQLRKADLAARVAAYRRMGVPAMQIFLVGHSAGAWAELLLKAEQPNLFNAVVAIAPAFAGEEASRDTKWQERRRTSLSQLAAAVDLSALIFSFEGDSYEEPQDLRLLATATNVHFRGISRTEQAGAGCRRWVHETLFDSCFAATWGQEIADYLNDRLP